MNQLKHLPLKSTTLTALIAALVSVVMVCALMPSLAFAAEDDATSSQTSATEDDAVETETGTTYTAYTEKDSETGRNSITLIEDGADNPEEIPAYCYNIGKKWPSESGSSYTASDDPADFYNAVSQKERYGNSIEEQLETNGTVSQDVADMNERIKAVYEKISTVLWYGFGNQLNDSTVRDQFDLNDIEHRAATQDAIHALVDGTIIGRSVIGTGDYAEMSDKEIAASTELVRLANSGAGIPEGWKPIIYLSENNTFQNLVTAVFVRTSDTEEQVDGESRVMKTSLVSNDDSSDSDNDEASSAENAVNETSSSNAAAKSVSATAQTGDAINPLIITAIAALALIAIGGSAMAQRKKNN